MSESSGASSAQTGYHARRVHRAFHIRTLKAVKKVVNRDERRLRAENEEKSTLSMDDVTAVAYGMGSFLFFFAFGWIPQTL